MAGFFFTGEDSLTPDAVDRKRILLNALRKDNLSTAPVQHLTQAAARVMGSLGDTLEERQLNRTEKQGVDENKAALLAALGLGGAASPPAPSAGAALPASQPAPATIPSAPLAPPQPGPPMASDGTPMPPIRPASLGGQGAPSMMAAADVPLSNMSPISGSSPVLPSGSFSGGAAPAIASALGNGQPVNVPPGAPPGTPKIAMNPTGQAGDPNAQPSEQELVARTIAAEAGGKSQQEANAIAAVILNRAKSRKLSPADVVLERNQFEPWNGGPGGRNDPMSIDMNSPRGQQAMAALQAALGGQDPTGGATHFVGTAAQAALGRPMPAWSRQGDMRQQIGATTFYAPEGRVTGGAPVQMAQAGQPSQTDAGSPAPGAAQAQFNVPGAPAQSGSSPQAAALLQALSSPWAARNPMLAQLGQKVLGEQLTGNKFGFQVVGDQLYRTSPKTGQVELVPGPKSGNWSIIKDNNGNPVARMEAKTGEIIPLNQGAGGLPEGGPKTSDVAELRKEVLQLPSYKNLAQAAPIYQSMFKTAGTNSKASDLNLVYGLGKIMDPGSVVREGEMIMVKNTASLPDWLVGAANSLNGGQQLTPETRAAILKEAHNRVTSYQEQFNNDSAHYQGIAGRNKMRTEDVIPSFGEFKPWEAPKAPSQGATPPMQPSPLSPTPQQQTRPPVKVNTPEEARKLPKGTPFITPDGRQGVIP